MERPLVAVTGLGATLVAVLSGALAAASPSSATSGAPASLPPPQPPVAGSPAWRPLKTVEGVRLARAEAGPGLPPWGLGEGEVAAPFEEVVAHLTDFAGLGRWLPRIERVEVLERGSDQALVYFRFDLPWPISDRDWTVRYSFSRGSDGGFRMRWVDENHRSPPARRVVRVSPVRGSWEVTATSASTTRVRYLFLAALGGHLPRRVVDETVWKQPLNTILGVRRAVAQERPKK